LATADAHLRRAEHLASKRADARLRPARHS
jgi:hypothetical protein